MVCLQITPYLFIKKPFGRKKYRSQPFIGKNYCKQDNKQLECFSVKIYK